MKKIHNNYIYLDIIKYKRNYIKNSSPRNEADLIHARTLSVSLIRVHTHAHTTINPVWPPCFAAFISVTMHTERQNIIKYLWTEARAYVLYKKLLPRNATRMLTQTHIASFMLKCLSTETITLEIQVCRHKQQLDLCAFHRTALGCWSPISRRIVNGVFFFFCFFFTSVITSVCGCLWGRVDAPVQRRSE